MVMLASVSPTSSWMLRLVNLSRLGPVVTGNVVISADLLPPV